MPYAVVLKDERRTSNIERPTSNEKQKLNAEHLTAISVSSSFPIKSRFYRDWTFDVGRSFFFSKPSTVHPRKK